MPNETAYIPLVLPTVTTDASVAMIRLGRGNLLEEVTTDAVVSLLAASQDGREPQLGGDSRFLPPGFPFNGAMLMYGGNSVNRQLLTPMTKVFSLHRNWNNHRACSATPEDLSSLCAALGVGNLPPSSAPSSLDASVIHTPTFGELLCSVLRAMDRIVYQCPPEDPDHNLGGYERLFKKVVLECIPDTPMIDFITRQLYNDLQSVAPGPQRESKYWLALNQMIPHITPVFLSPVNFPGRWLLSVMRHGSLVVSRSPYGDIPVLTEILEPGEVIFPSSCFVTTTLYEPNPASSPLSLSSSVSDNESVISEETNDNGNSNSNDNRESEESEEQPVDDDDNINDDRHDTMVHGRDERRSMDTPLSRCVCYLSQRSLVLPGVIRNFCPGGSDVHRLVLISLHLFFSFSPVYPSLPLSSIRVADILRLCCKEFAAWAPMDLQPFLEGLFLKSFNVDYLCYKADAIFGRIVYRRVFLFRFLLDNFRSPNSECRQLLLDICAFFPSKCTASAIGRLLTVPGPDKGILCFRSSLSSSVKHDDRLRTLDFHPLHCVPLFRPSRTSTIAGCRGPAEPPIASQRMSQFEATEPEDAEAPHADDSAVDPNFENLDRPLPNSINFSMEQLRLRAFAIPTLRVAWMLLDCYAPTSMHAASLLRLLVGGTPSPVVELFPFQWDEPALHDLVIFFWDSLQCLSAQLKHYYNDSTRCGTKPNRRTKRDVLRVSRIVLFHSLPYWIISFLQTYGFNPQTLGTFSSIDSLLVGGLQYERIKTLRLLSLSLRMKSKVPKLLGGRFHAMVSDKFRPVISDLFSLCMEMVTAHDEDHAPPRMVPLSMHARGCFSSGETPLSNPFPWIYEAIVEFLPLAVDRARCDVREIRKGYPGSWPDSTPPPTTRKRRIADVDRPPGPPPDDPGEVSDNDLHSQSATVPPRSNRFVLDECEASSSDSSPSVVVPCAPARHRQRTVSSPGFTGAASPPPCNGLHPRRDGCESHDVGLDGPHSHHVDDYASVPKQRIGHAEDPTFVPKQHICGVCKDLLYQFFLSGLQKGHSPGATGAYLWSILCKRHQNMSQPASAVSSSSVASSTSMDEPSLTCISSRISSRCRSDSRRDDPNSDYGHAGDDSSDDIHCRRQRSLLAVEESSDDDVDSDDVDSV